MVEKKTAIKTMMFDILLFAHHGSRIKLRKYQVDVAVAVANSVIDERGLTFVVQFPRQSGKNELQAQIEAYLLALFSQLEAEMVKISPTWKPQTLNAMRRLERVLEKNLITKGRWEKNSGYIYRFGNARIFFLSGSPTSNVVGATAETLLECDEAQDIICSKWDKDFGPMAASTNATRVFWGTAWTSQTLLSRERKAAEEAQAKDGIQRVFVIDADEVAKEVPAYGKFVAEQVAKLGRQHPLVKTQYFGEEIDAEGGMFPLARMALMRGTHEYLLAPRPNEMYACLIDVAGEDEGASLEIGELNNPGRDSTAMTVVEIDLATVQDELIRLPTYRVVSRYEWVGVKHTDLYGALRTLIEHWNAVYTVIDATGIGAGLASFLERAFSEKVIPFVFSQASKSKLGWDYLGVIDSGRFKDWQRKTTGNAKESLEMDRLQGLFYSQAECCQYEVIPGPGKMLRWGVAEGRRSPITGELVHDDLLISAALVSVLDEQDWALTGPAIIVTRPDPLLEMDREGF